jgi:dethiobiotin synthetase
MRALRIGAVFVTEPGLGTLNHTLLSLRELARGGVGVVGVVINNARGIERDYIYDDNAAEIRRYMAGAPCVEIDNQYQDNIAEAPMCDNHLRSDGQNKYNEITGFCNAILSAH